MWVWSAETPQWLEFLNLNANNRAFPIMYNFWNYNIHYINGIWLDIELNGPWKWETRRWQKTSRNREDDLVERMKVKQKVKFEMINFAGGDKKRF